MSNFGRLEPVAIREGWPREDSDFTPWLASGDNLEVLGTELGISLELVEIESSVGPFRADILAKQSGTENAVIIENQFGITDHSHLGQLLTYAAGLGGVSSSKTIVWIAEKFTEPHRAALDWLNQATESGIGFFAVELQLWRIGNSPFAPRFNVVSRPNHFQKELTQQVATYSDTDRLYQRFWQAFIDFCGDGTTLDMPSAPSRFWLPTFIGRTGFGVNLTASKQRCKLECQLYLSGQEAKQVFQRLEMEKERIREVLGPHVIFDEMLGRKACKIYEAHAGDISDEENWPELHSWLKTRGEAYVAMFKPLTRQ